MLLIWLFWRFSLSFLLSSFGSAFTRRVCRKWRNRFSFYVGAHCTFELFMRVENLAEQVVAIQILDRIGISLAAGLQGCTVCM
jgi:hypothetical protein